MEYLIKEDFTLINKMTVERHGGNFVEPDNFLHQEALDYLLDAVKAEMFGEELYPGLSNKAGLYMFNTIDNHIFQDGNKRTGLEVALLFLRLNGSMLKSNLKQVEFRGKKIPATVGDSNEILYQFTMKVASGKLELEDVQFWFENNIV